jgi:hypothetical protein
MINKTFEGKKYRRTYIGGSKEQELAIFLKVQGTKEDNSECDWFEYRRILSEYINDNLHVLVSWKILTQKIGIILLISSILFLKLPIIFFTLIGLSMVFMAIHVILKLRQDKKLSDYDMCLTITLGEIRKETGLELSK